MLLLHLQKSVITYFDDELLDNYIITVSFWFIFITFFPEILFINVYFEAFEAFLKPYEAMKEEGNS